MAFISTNEESLGKNYGYSSQLTDWILDSGETCHMTPEISNFIPGLLMETYKYIKVSEGNFVTEKQTGEVQIKIHDNNGKPCIDMLNNVRLAPDLCN